MVPGFAFVVEIVCTGIILVPEEVNPVIPGVAVAVQVKAAPAGLEVRLTNVVVKPEHTVCVKGILVTTGVSLIVNDLFVVTDDPHSLVTINDTV